MGGGGGGGGNILSGVARGGGRAGGGGAGPRAPALEGAPAQLQRRSQVSLAGVGGGADRIPCYHSI